MNLSISPTTSWLWVFLGTGQPVNVGRFSQKSIPSPSENPQPGDFTISSLHHQPNSLFASARA